MAARPRTHNINIPNLYAKLDKRTDRVYWQYKHPMTGRFHSLGTDEAEAKTIANEANLALAEQRSRQVITLTDKNSRVKNGSISVTTWLDRYLTIQQERLSTGELKPNSVKQKNAPVERMREKLAMKQLPLVDARDIAEILDEVKAKGHNRMAQVVRTVLIDVFKEAQHAGEVPPGYNPAEATKQPRNKIQRERLNIEEWRLIYDAAGSLSSYVQNSMLLALVTGQRLGDISNMQFKDVWDDCLHVTQEKTGARIAIPLALRCSAINMSLREVVAKCRGNIISQYLVHYDHTSAMAKRGGKSSAGAITTAFSKARDLAAIEWKNGSPPTFHEQRSLSERLYRDQGIDTKKLLGHKNQKMTDKYNDDRGKEWLTIAI